MSYVLLMFVFNAFLLNILFKFVVDCLYLCDLPGVLIITDKESALKPEQGDDRCEACLIIVRLVVLCLFQICTKSCTVNSCNCYQSTKYITVLNQSLGMFLPDLQRSCPLP